MYCLFSFWWQYLISSGIFILGLAFFVALKSEEVKLIKKNNSIEVIKMNAFGRKKKIKTRKISNILNLEIVKRGNDNMANRTIHYKIIIYFSEERPLEILETTSKQNIKMKVIYFY